MVLNGQNIRQDFREAENRFPGAAELGDSDAMVNPGSMHGDGAGAEQDYRLAEEWDRRAAGPGNAAAMYYPGALYEKGDSVSRNDPEAVN